MRSGQNPQLKPEQTPSATLAEQLGQLRLVGGNNFELIFVYDEIIDRLIADIDTAENHVHLKNRAEVHCTEKIATRNGWLLVDPLACRGDSYGTCKW